MKTQKPQHEKQDQPEDVSRRKFLKMTGMLSMSLPLTSMIHQKGAVVSLICDKNDPVAATAPVQWAIGELGRSLKTLGVKFLIVEKLSQAPAGTLCVVASGSQAVVAKQLLKEARITVPAVPEALGLIPITSKGQEIVLACGFDERGLIYALLELADRVIHSTQPVAVLKSGQPITEQPANKVRGLNRLFTSDIEDKPWFNDQEMWPRYLTMLATQRFNRFNLSFGIGYDFLQNVTDSYFLFAYPFLLDVPGYQVRIPQLPVAERDQNLKMLQFISEQTKARGMDFQLGLWMHGYEWLNSPHPNYTIEGLSKENHGPYCRDAVRALLKACPAIHGITLRIHGESGVTEGSYDFWKMIFDGVATCGRKVEIDMHSKGMDQGMIDAATTSGMPVTISPKYWAEHMGIPYHQADIRNQEVPKTGQKSSGLMNLSTGSRSFTRYGYGDLLKEKRPYQVVTRIWPGTQRLLLWGDPLTAAAHSRAFGFCGSDGVEIMEPLSFKGRRGSGIAGDRCGYADAALKPRWDWEKYLYTLRVFGRMLYNPETAPGVWKRQLRDEFGSAAGAAELALANATRILPIVLTVHDPSAANNNYWPEMYTNQPIADASLKHPFSDTPAPKVFGNVSPLDPQIFLGINEFAKKLMNGERSGKYTPVEAAQWIEDYADEAEKQLKQATKAILNDRKATFRRMAIDVNLQIGLGRFFGAKFRSAVLWDIFEQSGDRRALEAALKRYRQARDIWEKMALAVKNVYQKDITVGENPFLRGHWLDRLPLMDQDIEYMAKKLSELPQVASQNSITVKTAIDEVLGRPIRNKTKIEHLHPKRFNPGSAIILELTPERQIGSAILYYRHVNQGERFQKVQMSKEGNRLFATIPGDYTNYAYPLEYYFELRENPQTAWLYPGFNETLTNAPYFVILQNAG